MDDKNIIIDKDIPIPSRARVSSYNYPFADMEVGDSFLIETMGPYNDSSDESIEKEQTRIRHRIRNAANKFKKNQLPGSNQIDYKFAIHVVLETKEEKTTSGVRCWRVQ